MATIDDLNAEVARLQASVDTMQAAIAADEAADQAVIATLTAERDALQALIDAGAGATPEQLQGVLDGVTAAITDIESTPA